MQAGKKDQPIYFESPTVTNNSGSVTTSWADAAGNSPPEPDWAYIISQRGDEAFQSARTESDEIIRLCVNYRDDLQTTWRLKWLNQYYHIVRADRSNARAGELWITARILGVQ